MPAQTIIQLRRDTAANWTSTDPVLAVGEAGYETDSNQFKIGNGTDSWSLLAYQNLEGPAGDGYDFPAIDYGITQPPAPQPIPPNPLDPGEEWGTLPFGEVATLSLAGRVGAYKVGDLVRYSNPTATYANPNGYIIGRIISVDDPYEGYEGLTFFIVDASTQLPAVQNQGAVLSIIGEEGLGYSFKQAVRNPGFGDVEGQDPDPDPTPPDYWEDLVSGTSILEIRGIAGAFKVGDYVQVTNPFENPGAFIKGYITDINNYYGLNDFLSITIDSWDSAGAAAETSFDVTPGHVKLSIAGEAGADGEAGAGGEAGDPIILQSLYSRPDIEIVGYFSAPFNGFFSTVYQDTAGVVSLGTITKQEASSLISIDFPVTVNIDIASNVGFSYGSGEEEEEA